MVLSTKQMQWPFLRRAISAHHLRITCASCALFAHFLAFVLDTRMDSLMQSLTNDDVSGLGRELGGEEGARDACVVGRCPDRGMVRPGSRMNRSPRA